jgi:superfamily II DNA or RNA helicase
MKIRTCIRECGKTLNSARMVDSWESSTKELVDIIDDIPENECQDILQRFRNIGLHPHQTEGVMWMLKRWKVNRNMIIADEMGLGKTLQTLSFLLTLKEFENQTGPFLVIAPLSVAPQWTHQGNKFLPSLQVFEYMGSAEDREVKRRIIIEDHILKLPMEARDDPQPLPFDVMISTYETVLSDIDFVEKFKWRVIVFDEGHRLKNPDGVTYRTFLDRLQARSKVILTGTPIQNNITEFWALVRFLHPDIFPEFTRPDASFSIDFPLVSRIVDGIVLRRLFATIRGTLQLPALHQMVIRTDMTKIQADLYKWALYHYASAVKGQDSSSPPAGILSNLMMTLRKISSHPYLIPGVEPEPFSEGEHIWQNSNKLTVLRALLNKMRAENNRCLIFSGFTSLLDIVQDFLDLEDIKYERLDGSVRREDRVGAITRFNQSRLDSASVFLLSTHAGGIGLNLAAANWVIFMDTDFNPQIDLQAIARAHRQGQAKEVKVFRLVTKDSIDEIIFARSVEKLKFSQKILRESDKIESKEMKNLSLYGIRKFVQEDVCRPESMPIAGRDAVSSIPVNIDDIIESLDEPGASEEELVIIGKDREYRQFEGIDYANKKISLVTDQEELADIRAMDELISKAVPPPTTVPTVHKTVSEEQRVRIRQITEENRKKRRQEKWMKLGYTSFKISQDENSVDSCLSRQPGTIHHLHGSVVAPVVEDNSSTAIIVHQVDNSGFWPTTSRLFMSIAEAFPEIPKYYYKSKQAGDLRYGDVHLVHVGSRKFVALCVCHREEYGFDEFKLGLRVLSSEVAKRGLLGASFHFSRVGEKRGNLYVIERLINNYICASGFEAYLYYFRAHEQQVLPSPPKKKVTLLEYFKSVVGSRPPKSEITEPTPAGRKKIALSPRIKPTELMKLYSKLIAEKGDQVVEWESTGADMYVESVFEGKQGLDRTAERLVKHGKRVQMALNDEGVCVINTTSLEYYLTR